MNDMLALAQITVDPTLQPRVGGLNAEHVRALQETPDAWPPLLVVQHGNTYTLLDGFHRLAAAQNLGVDRVPITVVPYPTDGDLAILAFRANLAHGLPLTLADKRAYAERLLMAHPHVSNLEIARQTVLSPTTIAAIRERLEDTATIAPTGERVGKGGYTYAVPDNTGRPAGSLPPVGIGTQIGEAVGQFFTPAERKRQRAVVQYAQRLLVALEDQYTLDGWEDADGVAEAVRLVLGDARATVLGEQLGTASGQVYDVAVALDYREGGNQE